MADNIVDRILELAEIEEEKWEDRLALIPSWHPRNESGTGSGGSGGSDDGGDDGDDDDDSGDDGGDDGGTDDDKKIDWKAMARKHERTAKKERKERERLEREAKDRDSADQSEHEKAVQAAREEGEKTARDAAAKDRRSDRLENATIKLASRGIKVKIDDEEKTLRFTDPDDAFVYVERMIRSGDLDEDDLFDDNNRVNTGALQETLEELLDSKPHLAVGAGNGSDGSGSSGRRKVKGSADGGKGSGGSKSVEDMTTEEHFERIRQHK